MVPKIVDLLKLRLQAKKKGLLEEFGINVTEIARRGDIDPVIGRDDEIIDGKALAAKLQGGVG